MKVRAKTYLAALAWALPAMASAFAGRYNEPPAEPGSPYAVLKEKFDSASRPATAADLPPLSLQAVAQWQCYSVQGPSSKLEGPFVEAPVIVTVPVVIDPGKPGEPEKGPLFPAVPAIPGHSEMRSAIVYAQVAGTGANPSQNAWAQAQRDIATNFLSGRTNSYRLSLEPALQEIDTPAYYGDYTLTTSYRVSGSVVISRSRSDNGFPEAVHLIHAYTYCFKGNP